MSVADRFLRDLKASAPKTAALAVLVLVGLYFWIPPLWRMAVGRDAASATTAEPAVQATAPTPTVAATSQEAMPAGPPVLGWEEAERLRSEDDLFRSASRSDIRSDAFTFDDGFLPIDVVFAEDPSGRHVVIANERRPEPQAAAAAIVKKAGSPPPPLKLGSTLVGSDRRAAIINDKVYAEGATVTVADRTWTLRNVEPRRVVLDGDGGTVELTIAPFAKARAGR